MNITLYKCQHKILTFFIQDIKTRLKNFEGIVRFQYWLELLRKVIGIYKNLKYSLLCHKREPEYVVPILQIYRCFAEIKHNRATNARSRVELAHLVSPATGFSRM